MEIHLEIKQQSREYIHRKNYIRAIVVRARKKEETLSGPKETVRKVKFYELTVIKITNKKDYKYLTVSSRGCKSFVNDNPPKLEIQNCELLFHVTTIQYNR